MKLQDRLQVLNAPRYDKATEGLVMYAVCDCGWHQGNIWSLDWFAREIRDHRKRCELARPSR